MKRASIIALLVLVPLIVVAATQSKNISYDDTSIQNDHGSYQRLPDAGFRVECCGIVLTPAGKLVPVDSPCVSSEAGGLAASFNACTTYWRSTNGF